MSFQPIAGDPVVQSLLTPPHDQDITPPTSGPPLPTIPRERAYHRAKHFMDNATGVILVFQSALQGGSSSLSGSVLFKLDKKCLPSDRILTLLSGSELSGFDGLSGSLVFNFNPQRDEGVEITTRMIYSQLGGVVTRSIDIRPHVTSRFPTTTASYCKFPIDPPLTLFDGKRAGSREFTANTLTFYRAHSGK